MYATAAEAIEGLRHKQTGEILPSKVIDRNTKLVYLDESLIGLRFHDTIIAKYMRDRVVIDTRDSNYTQGWFTKTTWERINTYTPARTFASNGLRHIMIVCCPPGQPYAYACGGSMLYMHGTEVFPDGTCNVPDLHMEQSQAIVQVKRSLPAKIDRHARRVVKSWREWAQTPDCCHDILRERDALLDVYLHSLQHVTACEYVVPRDFELEYVSQLRDEGFQGDALCRLVAKKYAADLKNMLIPLAIRQITPNLPYPQSN